jgi:hypothetical protein
MPSQLSRLGPAVVGAAGAGLCALTLAVTVSGSASDYEWVEGFARALMFADPLADGVYSLRLPPIERFGKLLISPGLHCYHK